MNTLRVQRIQELDSILFVFYMISMLISQSIMNIIKTYYIVSPTIAPSPLSTDCCHVGDFWYENLSPCTVRGIIALGIHSVDTHRDGRHSLFLR